MAGLGGTVAWPVVARAQQPERMRRIGVLMNLAEDDPDGRMRLTAFLQALQELGWIDGCNMRIDTRWAGGNANDIRRHAAELVVLRFQRNRINRRTTPARCYAFPAVIPARLPPTKLDRSLAAAMF
jgi:hypothetical protein